MMMCEASGCVWTGGDLDQFSQERLKVEVEERLFVQHGVVSESAFMELFNRLFTKRQALNNRYMEHEKNREPVTTTVYEIKYDPQTHSERLWNPDAEMYLGTMLENTRRYAEREHKPELYNPLETAALLLLEQHITKGDVSYGVIPAYDPARTVRYMTEMKRDGSTVIARYTDIGLAGGDLTPQEVVALMKRLENAQPKDCIADHNINYPLLMVRNIQKTDVRPAQSTGMHAVSYDRQNETFAPVVIRKNDIIRDTVETAVTAGVQVTKDAVSAMYSLGTLRVAEILHRKKKVQKENPFTRESPVHKEAKKNVKVSIVPQVSEHLMERTVAAKLPESEIIPNTKETIKRTDSPVLKTEKQTTEVSHVPKKEKENTVKHRKTIELPQVKMLIKERLISARIKKLTVAGEIKVQEKIEKKQLKSKERIKKRERRIRVRAKKLLERTIKTLSRRIENFPRQSLSKSVNLFVLAYTVRVLLRIPEPVKAQEKTKMPEVKRDVPWLLFAIIWYLAMIREQGAISKVGAQYQSKKKKKPVQRHAVIFAFRS